MRKNGLTPLQTRAAELIARGKGKTEKKIVEELGIAKATLQEWKGNITFRVKVWQMIEDNAVYETANRAAIIREYLTPIYKRLGKKLKNPDDLKTLSVKELVKVMTQLHAELRADKSISASSQKYPMRGKPAEGTDPLGLGSGPEELEDEEEEEYSLGAAGELYTESRKLAEIGSKVTH